MHVRARSWAGRALVSGSAAGQERARRLGRGGADRLPCSLGGRRGAGRFGSGWGDKGLAWARGEECRWAHLCGGRAPPHWHGDLLRYPPCSALRHCRHHPADVHRENCDVHKQDDSNLYEQSGLHGQNSTAKARPVHPTRQRAIRGTCCARRGARVRTTALPAERWRCIPPPVRAMPIRISHSSNQLPSSIARLLGFVQVETPNLRIGLRAPHIFLNSHRAGSRAGYAGLCEHAQPDRHLSSRARPRGQESADGGQEPPKEARHRASNKVASHQWAILGRVSDLWPHLRNHSEPAASSS